LAYDVTGKGKTALKASWGRFNHKRDLDPEITSANQNLATATTWKWHDLNNDRLYEPGEINLDPNGHSLTKTDEPILTPASGLPTYDPNAEVNTANHTWEWLGKVSGAYLFPGEIMASANFQALSGTPYARTALFTATGPIPSIVLNVEPIGARRLPSTELLDFRFEKRIPFGKTRVLSAQLNLYNALNANTVTSVIAQSGPSFGNATAIVPARIVVFGLKFNF
jgi:hypothetical protein